jgi:hypothetical protein
MTFTCQVNGNRHYFQPQMSATTVIYNHSDCSFLGFLVFSHAYIVSTQVNSQGRTLFEVLWSSLYSPVLSRELQGTFLLQSYSVSSSQLICLAVLNLPSCNTASFICLPLWVYFLPFGKQEPSFIRSSFFFLFFYLEMILNLLKSCKNSKNYI